MNSNQAGLKKRLGAKDLPIIKRPIRYQRLDELSPGPVVGRGGIVTLDDGVAFLRKMSATFRDQSEKVQIFNELMTAYRTRNIKVAELVKEVEELFNGHDELITGFKAFLPLDFIDKGEEATAQEDAPPEPAPNGEAHRFLKRIQERFERGIYNSFLEIINQFRLELKGHDEVYEEVQALFEGHPDLQNEFRQFIHAPSATLGSEDVLTVHRQGQIREENVEFLNDQRNDEDFRVSSVKIVEDDFRTKHKRWFVFYERVKESLTRPDYQEFMRCLDAYKKEALTREYLKSLGADLLDKFPDLLSEFKEFLEHCKNIDEVVAALIDKPESSSAKKFRIKIKGKNRAVKPIQDLDLSTCELVTPSYRLLPKDYVPTAASHGGLLNDKLVSVTSGSEFKHASRNKYEESILQCEDDMFELDMLLERAMSTLKCAETMLNVMYENEPNSESGIRIEDYFSAINLRCIEQVYGDQGLEVIDLLRSVPLCILPVIISRLKKKHGEWSRSQAHIKPVWSEVYAKNHRKSLDQRSINFKQEDLKNFSRKVLVDEINLINEKKQSDEDLVLAVNGGRSRKVSHIEIEYPDAGIHDDLYELVKYSCQVVCTTKQQSDKIVSLWTRLLEMILGVQSNPHNSENVGDFQEPICTPEGCNSRAHDESEREEGEITPEDASEAEIDGSDSDKDDKYSDANEHFSSDEVPQEEHDKDMPNARSKRDGASSSLLGEFLEKAKPLHKRVISENQEGNRNSRMFYGNENFYILFRLHKVVYERLLSAKQMSSSSDTNPGYDVYHGRFMNALYNLLEGTAEQEQFEDECRDIMGNQSYILFTLDKLMYKLVKQLQTIFKDKACDKLIQLHECEHSRSKFVDEVYQDNVHHVLPEESIYRFEYLPNQCKLCIQLIDGGDMNNDASEAMDPWFVNYLNKNLLSASRKRESRGVFLPRNMRKYSGLDKSCAMSKAMEGVLVENGLQLKICTTSLKVSYVLGTEDILIRFQQQQRRTKSSTSSVSSSRDNQERVKRFHRLLETTL